MKIISLVANGFQNDNRVERMAKTIQKLGTNISIIGWKKGELKEHEVINGIQVHRVFPLSSQWKRSNKWIGLFQFLHFQIKVIQLYRKVDVWHCNDFEAFWIGLFAKLTRPKLQLVYDLHEYQKERLGTPWYVRFVIGIIERYFIKKACKIITISPGIKKEYEKLYGLKDIALVRNTPHLTNVQTCNLFREKFAIRPEQKIFLYQGMLGPDRGIEELLEAFQSRKDDRAVLVIMGQGKLQAMVKKATQQSHLIFHHPYVSYQDINQYSSSADVGLNMAKNSCLNHTYCLPNKIFEYIQALLPIMTNDLVDCRQLITSYRIGHVISDYNTIGINQSIDEMLMMDFSEMKKQLQLAKMDLNWEKEELQLIAVYNDILGKLK